MQIYVDDSPEESARSAAKGMARAINAAVRARGVCTIALSGGRSPAPLFAALAGEDIPWDSVHLFQVDERATPADDSNRNWLLLQSNLLQKVAIPSNNLHPILIDVDKPYVAAESYAKTLRTIAGQQPVIDIVHLGLGHDGHLASLVPDDSVLDVNDKEVAVTQAYEGYRRITLTYPCLRRARQIAWFVTGSEKTAMLRRLRSGDVSIPAGRLGHDHATIYADRAAAIGATRGRPRCVLSIDVGGSHVKLMDSINRERRQFESGTSLTPQQFVHQVQTLTADWAYDAVTMGVPGPVRNGTLIATPPNLGTGWVGFDHAAAFDRPLKIVNDAAMQALGSYRHGKMLFLGLGTGLGSTLIVDRQIVAMELGHLPYRKNRSFEDYVGEHGLKRMGKTKWRHHVEQVVAVLTAALLPDEVVLGGGNVRHIKSLPNGCRRGDNQDAFLGGFKAWDDSYQQQ